MSNLSSDEGDEWQEMDADESTIKCLFCKDVFPLVEEALIHCKTKHNFDLHVLKLKFNMDCYSYIKMINYIRTHNSKPDEIMHMQECQWESDQYLKPIQNDDWLWFDFETVHMQKPSSPKTYHANVENGVVTLSQSHFCELQRTIHDLTTQLNESQTHLQMAKEDIEKMQKSMVKIVDSGDSSIKESNHQIVNCVSKVALEDDEGYFNTYAHFGIHYEMLSDKVRTESYRDAILSNKPIFKDKLVLDLGCGTGILSMFSATAGAKKVFAIDQSEIIYHAIDIILENKLQDVIKTIKGRIEETNINENVDIIVSEWMGYFLLFEGMLDSVIYARDKYLKPGGLLLPNRCEISLIACGDTETHNKFVNYWSDVYGYKMSCMKSEVIREASISIVDSKHLISEPFVIKSIDIMTCRIDTMDFTSDFKLQITKDGHITSLVGYFDTFFELPNRVAFSTGPHAEPTHWKQTVFHFKDSKNVKKGDIIDGTIICSRQTLDVRALSVQINVFGENHKYIIN